MVRPLSGTRGGRTQRVGAGLGPAHDRRPADRLSPSGTADQNDRVQVLTVDLFGEFGFLEEGDTSFDFVAIDFDLGDPDDEALATGLAEGSVYLGHDLETVENLSVSLGAGETTPVPVDAPARMLVLYQNNSIRHQHQVVRLGR